VSSRLFFQFGEILRWTDTTDDAETLAGFGCIIYRQAILRILPALLFNSEPPKQKHQSSFQTEKGTRRTMSVWNANGMLKGTLRQRE
jgi:hypothetical protein